MKAIRCILVCVLMVVVAVVADDATRASQVVCEAAVAALPSVDVFFTGGATSDDYTALDTVCASSCFADLQVDIQSWIIDNHPSLCGVDTTALSTVVGSLTAYLCLQDPAVSPATYCVSSLSAALTTLNIDITTDPIVVSSITAQDACGAAAATGCCFSTYLQILENLFAISGLTNLKTYSSLFLASCGTALLAPGSQYVIPASCVGFDVSAVDTNGMTPTAVDCNAAETDCATQSCGLLACMQDVAPISGSISNSDVQALVQQIAEELKRASATSEQCTIEGYGTSYWAQQQGGGSSGSGDCPAGQICNGAAHVGISIFAILSSALLALRFW